MAIAVNNSDWRFHHVGMEPQIYESHTFYPLHEDLVYSHNFVPSQYIEPQWNSDSYASLKANGSSPLGSSSTSDYESFMSSQEVKGLTLHAPFTLTEV